MGSGEEIRHILLQIISLIILAMPLFLLPAALKLSGSILGRINDMTKGGMNKYGGSQLDRAGKDKSKELWGRTGLQRMRKAKKAERDNIRARDHATRSAKAAERKGVLGALSRARYGVAVTPKGREAQREAFASAYDTMREDIGRTTERTRGRLTDDAAFTASSEYFDDKGEKMSKDKFMEHVYINKGTGAVKSLDGSMHTIDGSDVTVSRAIASQAAKSGDKAMYGKLLTAAQASGDGELEFRLRDQGINNASVVSGGHPDVVKGSYSAFKAVTPEALLSMDGSAVKRMGKYLGNRQAIEKDLELGIAEDNPGLTGAALAAKVTQAATAYQATAIKAFEQSVTDINTKSIYAGKAAVGGDLDKAVVEAAMSVGLNPAGSTPATLPPIRFKAK